MNFIQIAQLFDSIEKNTKRLNKILILRDFFEKQENKSFVLFDIIAGNFQREIDKKSLGISIKTIFSVLASISKTQIEFISKQFDKIGDIGIIASNILQTNKQKMLLSSQLKLEDIIKALHSISKISGTNSNKKKKEILSQLFLSAKTDVEHKFLARLLVDDLRIGVSVGVLREVAVNLFFPNIIGIHFICSKCGYVNLNMKNCFKCNTIINQKIEAQKNTIKKQANKYKNENWNKHNFQIVELDTPKKEIGLSKFQIPLKKDIFNFALRRNRKKHILSISNPRNLYNQFLKSFELKYNLINSFQIVLKQIGDNLLNVLEHDIILGKPMLSMLGPAVKNAQEAIDSVNLPCLIDYKYDGLRIQIHNDFGKVNLFSRNLDNITKQFPEIVDYIKSNYSDLEFVVDSECIAYDYKTRKALPFQVLSKRILTKKIELVKHINISCKIFDIMFLNHETLIQQPYKKRQEKLQTLFLNRKLKQKMYFDIDDLKKIIKNK